MRTCDKMKNYSFLSGLIEEAQVLANRMESGLEEFKGIRAGEQYRLNLRDEIKALEAKRDKLREDPGAGELPTPQL